MAGKKRTSQIYSTVATGLGMLIVCATLIATIAFPQLNVGVAVAVGALLGGPFLVLGMRLHPQATSEDEESRRFWPAGSEARDLFWGVVGFVTLAVCLLTPCLVAVLVWSGLPAGDNWNVVGVRLVFFTAAYCGWSWWLGACSRTVPHWFRGKLPDQFVDSFIRKETPDEPATVKDAAAKNWQLLVVALVAFFLAAGAINLNGLGLQPIARPGRARTIVTMIIWCQAHPNTTRATAALVAVAASITFLYRLRRAAGRPNENAGS
ncbi:MAG: hypothetical protein JNM43_27620 [Planctomycetaceae bacterium]|nr:hypothetical protein [Planctomycetaceae bacterium]